MHVTLKIPSQSYYRSLIPILRLLFKQYQAIFRETLINPDHWNNSAAQMELEPTTFQIHCSIIRAKEPRVDESHLILHVHRSFLRQTCVACISDTCKEQTINDAVFRFYFRLILKQYQMILLQV